MKVGLMLARFHSFQACEMTKSYSRTNRLSNGTLLGTQRTSFLALRMDSWSLCSDAHSATSTCLTPAKPCSSWPSPDSPDPTAFHCPRCYWPHSSPDPQHCPHCSTLGKQTWLGVCDIKGVRVGNRIETTRG